MSFLKKFKIVNYLENLKTSNHLRQIILSGNIPRVLTLDFDNNICPTKTTMGAISLPDLEDETLLDIFEQDSDNSGLYWLKDSFFDGLDLENLEKSLFDNGILKNHRYYQAILTAVETRKTLALLQELLLSGRLKLAIVTSNGISSIEERFIKAFLHFYPNDVSLLKEMSFYSATNGLLTELNESCQLVSCPQFGRDNKIENSSVQEIRASLNSFLEETIAENDEIKEILAHLITNNNLNIEIAKDSDDPSPDKFKILTRVANGTDRILQITLARIPDFSFADGRTLKDLTEKYLQEKYGHIYQIQQAGHTSINLNPLSGFKNGQKGASLLDILDKRNRQRPFKIDGYNVWHMGDELLGSDAIYGLEGVTLINTGDYVTITDLLANYQSRFPGSLEIDLSDIRLFQMPSLSSNIARANFVLAEILGYFEQNPQIVFLSGGTGAKATAQHLASIGYRDANFVLPMTDSGGSSGQMLDFEGQGLPIGDIRNRICAVLSTNKAIRKPAKAALVRFLSMRLPKNKYKALHHWHNIVFQDGKIDGIDYFADIDEQDKKFLLENLRKFDFFVQSKIFDRDKQGHKLKEFDFRGGSLGNFILHSMSNAANMNLMLAGQQLLEQAGVTDGYLVLPSLIDKDTITIAAKTEDGTVYCDQNDLSHPGVFVNKNSDDALGRVSALEFVRLGNKPSFDASLIPQANQEIFRFIQEAQRVVFTMGSVYTSILAVAMTPGLADALNQSKAQRMITWNGIYDRETSISDSQNLSPLDFLSDFLKYVNQYRKREEAFKLNELLDVFLYPKDCGITEQELEEIKKLGLKPIAVSTEKVGDKNYIDPRNYFETIRNSSDAETRNR